MMLFASTVTLIGWVPLVGAVNVVFTQTESPESMAGVESKTPCEPGTSSSISEASASSGPEFLI